MIPVQRPYLGEEELQSLRRIIDSRWLGMGSAVKEFEDRLREFLGAKHVVAVNTGTSALHIALASLDLAPGDEVILPSLTFVAAPQAVLATGATPVFCEVHPETLNIDVDDARQRLTNRTKVVMPVDFGGEPCEMDGVLALAREHGLRVIEDAAHAFGSVYRGNRVGSVSDVTCFSFDPIKNITCGEGGAVVTNDDVLASRMVRKRILGISNDTWSRYRNERNWFYEVVTPGYRYHMSNLNASIGLEQLKRLEEFRVRKQAIVRRYDQAFSELHGLALITHDLVDSFPFFYVVRVLNDRRDSFMEFLKEHGVATGVHYIPNHIQPLFARDHAHLPITEKLFKEIVTLPLYYEMTDSEVSIVVDAVRNFFAGEPLPVLDQTL